MEVRVVPPAESRTGCHEKCRELEPRWGDMEASASRRPGVQGTHDLACLKRELSQPSAARMSRSRQSLYWCSRTGVSSGGGWKPGCGTLKGQPTRGTGRLPDKAGVSGVRGDGHTQAAEAIPKLQWGQ